MCDFNSDFVLENEETIILNSLAGGNYEFDTQKGGIDLEVLSDFPKTNKVQITFIKTIENGVLLKIKKPDGLKRVFVIADMFSLDYQIKDGYIRFDKRFITGDSLVISFK